MEKNIEIKWKLGEDCDLRNLTSVSILGRPYIHIYTYINMYIYTSILPT